MTTWVSACGCEFAISTDGKGSVVFVRELKKCREHEDEKLQGLENFLERWDEVARENAEAIKALEAEATKALEAEDGI
jgi:hypothetical protein